MTNTEAFALAKLKATKGHRDWLVWSDRAGVFFAEVRTQDAVKRALLAVGTQGRYSLVDPKGRGVVQRWATGLRQLRNAKVGCFA